VDISSENWTRKFENLQLLREIALRQSRKVRLVRDANRLGRIIAKSTYHNWASVLPAAPINERFEVAGTQRISVMMTSPRRPRRRSRTPRSNIVTSCATKVDGQTLTPHRWEVDKSPVGVFSGRC